jgi:hypothetical protein
MTIEQTDVIDFINIDRATGDVWLTIVDHLPWESHEADHLLMLQNKLNAYLRFVESGEMRKEYPETLGMNVVISVVARFQLSDQASKFVSMASVRIRKAGPPVPV